MKRKTKQLLFGIVLIIVSIVVIYFNLKSFKGGFNKLWPSILLLFGLFFYVYYFSTKKKRERGFFLFLATFLAVSSIPLFILTFTTFSNINLVWPGFLLAFGISLMALYFFSKSKKVYLIVSSLTISASLLVWIFYTVNSPFGLVIGISLLLIGGAFITRGLIKDVTDRMNTETDESKKEVENKDEDSIKSSSNNQ